MISPLQSPPCCASGWLGSAGSPASRSVGLTARQNGLLATLSIVTDRVRDDDERADDRGSSRPTIGSAILSGGSLFAVGNARPISSICNGYEDHPTRQSGFMCPDRHDRVPAGPHLVGTTKVNGFGRDVRTRPSPFSTALPSGVRHGRTMKSSGRAQRPASATGRLLTHEMPCSLPAQRWKTTGPGADL